MIKRLALAAAAFGVFLLLGMCSASAQVRDPNVQPAPTPGKSGGANKSARRTDPLELPAITEADLQYEGCFRLPQQVGSFSTAYAVSGIALRRVNQRLRMFTCNHAHSGGAVYEVAVPELGKGTDSPEAKLIQDWGNIYGDGKNDMNQLTHGLRWDEAKSALWWSYGHHYSVDGVNRSCIGCTKLSTDGSKETLGYWKLGGAANDHRARGCFLELPAWFAERVTGGKTHAFGAGGCFAGNVTGSGGPFLVAANEPAGPSDSEIATGPVFLHYPYDQAKGAFPCRRSGDVVPDGTNGRLPDKDGGYWTWADTLWGGCQFIDLDDKKGLLFFGSLATGKVTYKGGLIFEGKRPVCLSYSLTQIAAVAARKVPTHHWRPLEITLKYEPKNTWGPYYDLITGSAFDAAERKIYLYTPFAYRPENASDEFPLVHVYKIRE